MKPLHCVARIVLPWGVDAAVLNPFLCASNEDLRAGSACGALAPIVVKQASYFLMYSSHSGTPTESPAGSVFATVLEAVFAAEFAVVFVTTAVFDLLMLVPVFAAVFAGEPHPIEAMAKQNDAARAKMLVVFIN
jgi:hypothetical protein